jgi:hypothetical protein
MSDYCEVCEGVALATSSCPATDVIMVRGEVANGSSVMVASPSPPVSVSVGDATDGVVIDAYALLVNAANGVSDTSPTLVVTEMLLSSANGVSEARQGLREMVTGVANATEQILVADASHLIVSAAQAASVLVGAGAIAQMTVGDTARAESFASLGLLETLTSGADAVSVIAVLQRRVNVSEASTAAATDEAYPSGDVETFLLLSTATGTSLINAQTDACTFISATAEAGSEIWYQDPEAKAWVMNTETTAVGWYDNFRFESIVSWKGRELAVGPDGVHELTGDTDNGARIDAVVASGFTDFGVAQTKRLDNMYFGYTSDGQIAVQTEVYESGSPPSTYLLEERDANAPRNSRVTPGKGLWGRYWRLTIKNVDGADFDVHDATVDIAVSPRRI